MKLTPAMQNFVVHWGEMGTRWGVNRTVAQIHALLYLSEQPLHAESIVDALGVARSNVSNSLKELQNWGLIKMTHVLGDRRDHFETLKDCWQMLKIITEQRKKREIDPTREALHQCLSEAGGEARIPEHSLKQMQQMTEFLDKLSDWYDQMAALPEPTLEKIVKTGAKVVKFIQRR